MPTLRDRCAGHQRDGLRIGIGIGVALAIIGGGIWLARKRIKKVA